jgi:protein arginine kinase
VELPRTILSNCGWLKIGDTANDLVISSRIRLARNLEGIPFSQWASSSDLRRIAELTKEAISQSAHLRDAVQLCIDDLATMDRQFLSERYLISREFVKSGVERHVIVHHDQTVSLMLNEEDHIRMQMILAGSNIRKAWDVINAIDDELEGSLDYAFSNRYGYLTACPTNVGTGIRCSVMVHLPAMVFTRKIEKILNAVTHMGLTVRGWAGEGSEIAGNLFQISNQWTLGISEENTIEKIEKILDQILDQEQRAQAELVEKHRMEIEDKIWRAHAILSNARVIATSEAIELFSAVRLGIRLGLLSSPSSETVNEMMIETRPAHLQKREGKTLSPEERDITRAKYIRKWISGTVNPH